MFCRNINIFHFLIYVHIYLEIDNELKTILLLLFILSVRFILLVKTTE